MLSRLRALMLLSECRGDEIWSEQLSREKGIPESWIAELADNFESGFESDRETIYTDDGVTNQYRGIRDLDLAFRLAQLIGIDSQRAIAGTLTREAQVRALQEAADEL